MAKDMQDAAGVLPFRLRQPAGPHEALEARPARLVGTVTGIDERSLKVEIGRRWAPGHAFSDDRVRSGIFESMNPPLDAGSDIDVQRALLRRVAPKGVLARLFDHARQVKQAAGGVR